MDRFRFIFEYILGSKMGPLRGPVSRENTRKCNGFGVSGTSEIDTILVHFGVISGFILCSLPLDLVQVIYIYIYWLTN